MRARAHPDMFSSMMVPKTAGSSRFRFSFASPVMNKQDNSKLQQIQEDIPQDVEQQQQAVAVNGSFMAGGLMDSFYQQSAKDGQEIDERDKKSKFLEILFLFS